MKLNLNIFILGISLLLTIACNNKKEIPSQQNSSKPYSPIDGNWEMVANQIKGKKLDLKSPQQFKIFNDGYYCFMMYDSLGSFYGAGAGTYEVKGNMYKETLTYYSNPKWVGSVNWQEWEMKGDTLVFYGFKKAIMPDGTDVTEEWGRDKFIEKRIRAKPINQ